MEFRLRRINFFHRELVIICQNENGPCPLLALANILLLDGKILISSDRSFISLHDLVQVVAEHIFERQSLRETHLEQEHVDAILNVLPKLAKGMDLNVNFTAVNKYEYTEEISVFDTLNIPLLHGWLYDPTESETAEVINTQSYNHLMFKLVEYKTLTDRLKTAYNMNIDHNDGIQISEQERTLLREGRIIDSFLTSSASQLTYHGLIKLYEFLQDRQFAVFFRNNHFSTLFFYQGQLFLLMTDLGFVDQRNVVWELLQTISG